MSILQIISLLFVVTALAGYINHRFIKLPMSIGLLLFSTFFSLIVIVLGHYNIIDAKHITQVLDRIDFEELVLHGILCLLLFAGALQVDSSKLKQYALAISIFSTLGVILAAFITAGIIYYLASFMNIHIQFIYCLLFGALIAPTDAVAVMSILNKKTKNEALKAKITGESLFNDGTGVVLFLTVLGFALAKNNDTISYSSAFYIFFKELLGGISIGLVMGLIVTYILKTIDQYEVEVMITLALAMGSYSLSEYLHVSAPIASVVAGLVIGNKARATAMSAKTIEHVDVFFKLIDEILNALLFMLIGLQIVSLTFTFSILTIGVIAIGAVLIGRFASLSLCGLLLLRTSFNFRKMPFIMTWCGLRGGISIALALSLPAFAQKETLLAMTYIVVIFSIIVQGTTIGKVIEFFE